MVLLTQKHRTLRHLLSHLTTHIMGRRDIAIQVCPSRLSSANGFADAKAPNTACSNHLANKKWRTYWYTTLVWQGRRDSNTQPAVLETAALPLSHSPKRKLLYIIMNFKSTKFNQNNNNFTL